jgi:hypothetical protein
MRNPFVVALTHPINLSMLALAAAAGLCAAWWLFPLGLVLWLVMVLIIARDPSLRISHRVESRDPLAQRFEAKFDRIESLQIKIYNTLNAASSKVKRAFQPVQDEVNALTEEAFQLCKRTSALENYRLVTESKVDLEAEWIRLSQLEANASDPIVKQKYQQSLQALENRVQRHRQVTSHLESVDAQLVSAANTLENILTEILRLQALGIEFVKNERGFLVERLNQERSQIGAYQQQQPSVNNNGDIIPPKGS